MFMAIRRVSHFENHVGASIGQLVSHHKILGFLLTLLGMPLLTLTAVCACTAIITLPIALVFGWI